jgi:hypothetical protein
MKNSKTKTKSEALQDQLIETLEAYRIALEGTLNKDEKIRALEFELDAARQIFAALSAARNINMHAYEEMAVWLQKRKEEQP